MCTSAPGDGCRPLSPSEIAPTLGSQPRVPKARSLQQRNCSAGLGKRRHSPDQQAKATSPPWPCGHHIRSLPELVVGQPAGFQGSWSCPLWVMAGPEEAGGEGRCPDPRRDPITLGYTTSGSHQVSYCICTSPYVVRKEFSRLYLGLLIDLLADAVSQHDEDGHGRLHVTLLCVEEERVPHDGIEEVGGQAVLVERVGDGDEGEGLHGCQ